MFSMLKDVLDISTPAQKESWLKTALDQAVAQEMSTLFTTMRNNSLQDRESARDKFRKALDVTMDCYNDARLEIKAYANNLKYKPNA